MIALWAWLTSTKSSARLLLQVHDELVLEVEEGALEGLCPGLKNVMEGVVDWEVPMTVEVEAGKNWGEMEGVC